MCSTSGTGSNGWQVSFLLRVEFLLTDNFLLTAIPQRGRRGCGGLNVALDPTDLNRVIETQPADARRGAADARRGSGPISSQPDVRSAAPRKRRNSAELKGAQAKRSREAEEEEQPRELPQRVIDRLGSRETAQRLVHQTDVTFHGRSTRDQKDDFPSSPTVPRLVHSVNTWKRMTGALVATFRKQSVIGMLV